jgi:two-component system CheB/CheR fusion protein
VPEFLRVATGQRKARAAFVGEWRHLKRDGSVFDVAITVSSISYAGRAALLVLVRDITDRKRAEAALQESEDRYRQLFEDALTGDFLATSAGKVLLCNPAFVKIYGFASRGRAERGDVARFNPEDWAGLVKRLRARRKIEGHQAWHKAADGRQIHIVENLVGLFNERKELIQVKGYVFDDTERKFAEELLKQLNATLERRVAERTEALTNANERLQAIMDAAQNGIITLDERGKIESLNPSALRIFGYGPNEMAGRNISRLMMSPQQTRGEEFLAHYLRAGQRGDPGVGGEVLGQRKDGRTIMLSLSVAEYGDGGRRKFVAMMRDITQRKRLERELLEISERERRQLGHDLHDGLGQHLHGLAYLAGLLEKDLREGASPRAPEAGRLSQHLYEALEMARNLAQGLQPVKAVPEGLTMALRELAQRARGVYRVDCQFECRTPVLIHRDSAANQLYCIAQEAVNNAMKHGKPTRICIQLKATAERIVLRVSDNGVGIRQPTKPGRGMGLHVMQYRADEIGGSLLVQRQPEGGTEVVCTVRRQALLPQDDKIK